MNGLIVGLYQMAVLPGDVSGNLTKLRVVLPRLKDAGARLVVLPEMWSCGFVYSVLTEMAERTPEVLESLREWAGQNGMILVGSLPELQEGRIYNSSYVVGSCGGILGKYRKIHLFSVTGEPGYFTRGEAPLVCKTELGRLGIAVCYDLRFPELARRMAVDGAEILCFSALWPAARRHHWSLLLRSRALENQLFVIGCNGCGTEGNTTYGGSSAVISPAGDPLVEAGDNEAWLVARLDFDEMTRFRRQIPCFEDRIPGVYGDF